MKCKRLSLLLTIMIVLAACSNQEYDRYIEKGIDHLGEKEYHQAALQFERALQQKEGDRTAAAYYHQANQMDNALAEYSQKDYDSSLESLETVIARKNGLKTVEEEATRLKSKIMEIVNKTRKVEAEIKLIESLIEKESFNTAQDKLKDLEPKLEKDEDLAVYQSQSQKLMEQADMGLKAMETKVQNEDPKKKQKEDKDKSEVTKKDSHQATKANPLNQKSIVYSTYNNERFGFSLQIPEGMTMDPPPTNGDGGTFRNGELTVTAYGGHTNTVQQGETIGTYYKQDMESITTNIAYKRLADDWYVISYEEAGTIYYKKFFFGENSFNTFIISYPSSMQHKYGSVTTHIAKTFTSAAY
ncbi:hypothetical protein [Pseudalkalibacillus caeni]|uniref:Uncharacterized protein n=1 Tax=Exobacillus caeni TaxID=2574798 RepID=A0A5R9F7V2_9BACL|nr:hypothetical protein [Pseudalkalibacillus caeni]TLS38599.1 hypothetical protein FCL54_03615 [Pseudalkalibacillus caeni]